MRQGRRWSDPQGIQRNLKAIIPARDLWPAEPRIITGTRPGNRPLIVGARSGPWNERFMTIQTVYKGYTRYLTSEPGYTSGVSAGSRQSSVSTQPPAQYQPDNKTMVNKFDGLHDHVQNKADVSALGGWRYNLTHLIDYSQEVMVAEKLAQARKNAVMGISDTVREATVNTDDRNRFFHPMH